MRILITNPGRKNYFIDFLIRIKKFFLPKMQIHLCDANENSSSFYVSNLVKNHITPKCEHKDKYYNSILKIIKKNKINLVIPLTDLDLHILSKKKVELKKFKCETLISNSKIINLCTNKILTHQFLVKNSLPTPKTLLATKKKNLKLPLIIKDIRGNSSQGFKVIKKDSDLNLIESKNKVLQEYIKGREYHLDILNDFEGNYIDHCSKIKLEMRDGETFKAKIINNSQLSSLAKQISKKLQHVGNLDCDIISNKSKYFIIDLNPRFGGGYPFTHISGKNYILKILSILKKKKYSIRKKTNLITAMKSIGISIKK